MDQQSAMVVSSGERPLELVIALWLDEKIHLSGSERTRRAYGDTLADFRRVLQSGGLELTSDADTVGDLAQAWLSQLHHGGKQLAPASRNLKLAILSSFYEFARRRRHLRLQNSNVPIQNPIDLVERSKVESYAHAVPLDREEMKQDLDRIDRSTITGLQDYALILVGVRTGRRLAELAGLRWEHVKFNGTPERPRVTVTFERAKGGKVMRDTLSQQAAAALIAYRDACITDETYAPERPIWVSYSSNGSAGHALHPRTISKLCLRYLKTGKAHALRHTFAHDMEKAKAPISVIQRRLGHSNAATTSRYLQSLTTDENEYADDLDALYT